MRNNAISSTYMGSFMQCLQKWYLRYHTDKKPIMSGEARAFGTAVHEALEHMYTILSEKKALPSEEDYDSVYKAFIGSGLKNQLSDQSLYEEGKLILKNRLDRYDPVENVIGLELKFGWPRENPAIDVRTSKGTPMIGAIDKLIELDKDTIVVLDYKTSRTALTESEAAVDPQLSLYDLVVSKLYPQYKNRILVLDYLRLTPVITHRTAEQRALFEDIIDEVYELAGSLEESEIKPTLNEYCGWCDYRDYCTAYQKVITDPDLLLKPLETMGQAEFVDEWVNFSNVKRAVDAYKRKLAMHASNIARDTGEVDLSSDKYTLYRTQKSLVSYDVSTVYDTVPIDDFLKMVHINKKSLDNYLSNHPEFKDKIESGTSVSFGSAFFRHKKAK